MCNFHEMNLSRLSNIVQWQFENKSSIFLRYWEDEQRTSQETGSYWNLTKEWNNVKKLAERVGQKTFGVEEILGSPGIFANLPKEFRKSASYRLRDLITSCTFDGQLCDWSLFRLYEHSEFFNCYTFQVSNDTYIRAGPESGLTLLLFIGRYICCSFTSISIIVV